MTIEVTRHEDGRLSIGRTPVRLGGGGHDAVYYILHCEHGDTQHHDTQGLAEGDVIARLIDEHHERLEDCACLPAT